MLLGDSSERSLEIRASEVHQCGRKGALRASSLGRLSICIKTVGQSYLVLLAEVSTHTHTHTQQQQQMLQGDRQGVVLVRRGLLTHTTLSDAPQ